MDNNAIKMKQYCETIIVIVVSICIWFRDYLFRGYTFISGAQQNLFVEWVMSHNLLHCYGIVQWNPIVLFGEDYVGREAFFNPLRIINLIGLIFPDSGKAFILITMVFIGLMGFFMYIFLRELKIEHLPSLIGATIYMMVPKWVDEGYHGPYFVIAFALLPCICLLIHRMYDTGFKHVKHFVLFSFIVALIYLSVGAQFLILLSYLFLPYFAYVLLLYCRENPEQVKRITFTIPIKALLSLAIFILLVAYILLPFLNNYFSSQRSLYGFTFGFSWKNYLGMLFPWVNRIFANNIYDLPYLQDSLVTNLDFYFGILSVPVFLYAFIYKKWNKFVSFFLFVPVLCLILWNSAVIKFFPILPWLEALSKGESSQYRIHVVIIFCVSVVFAYIFDEIEKNTKSSKEKSNDSRRKILRRFNIFLISVYVVALVIFLIGAIICNSTLRKFFWDGLLNKHALLLYYYFSYSAFIFITIFIVRILLLMGFNTKLNNRKWDTRLILLLIILDFQLCFTLWYPFTNTFGRYADEVAQNKFVIDRVGNLDRSAAFHYQLYNQNEKYKQFLNSKAEVDFNILLAKFSSIYHKGYVIPIGEFSLSYFPLIKSKNLYSFHESLMPDYFWDFDKFLNKNNPKFIRQSWIGLWDPHSKLLDTAGIKYIFWFEPIEDKRFEEVLRYGNNSRIYLNKNAVPKVYIVNSVEYFKNRNDLLKRLCEDEFNPLVAVTTEDDSLCSQMMDSATAKNLQSEVKILKYKPDEIVIETETFAKGVLVLNDMYHPNWSAKLNNVSTNIYRVNCLFRGIVLPKGKNVVEFKYYNNYFHLGYLMSLYSWPIVMLYLLTGFIRRIARK